MTVAEIDVNEREQDALSSGLLCLRAIDRQGEAGWSSRIQTMDSKWHKRPRPNEATRCALLWAERTLPSAHTFLLSKDKVASSK